MAEFNKELDKTIEKEVLDFPDRNTKIVVALMQYNEGQKKLQLSRVNVREGEDVFAKLGRLTKEEAEKVVEAMTNAIKGWDAGA
jgi:hypothetical protein